MLGGALLLLVVVGAAVVLVLDRPMPARASRPDADEVTRQPMRSAGATPSSDDAISWAHVKRSGRLPAGRDHVAHVFVHGRMCIGIGPSGTAAMADAYHRAATHFEALSAGQETT